MDHCLDRPALERVARFFAVMADATRLEILQMLKQRGDEVSVGDIVGATTVKQAAVSKQLAILAEAGLVARRREGNQVFYRISDDLVFALCELVCGKLGRDAGLLAQRFA